MRTVRLLSTVNRRNRTALVRFGAAVMVGVSMTYSLTAAAANLLSARADAESSSDEIHLQFDAPVSWRWFRLSEPERVVIDIRDGLPNDAARKAVATLGNATIKNTRIGELSDGMRVVFDLAAPVDEVSVGSDEKPHIRIRLARTALAEGPAPQPIQETPAVEVASASTGPLTTVVQRPVVVVIDAGHGGKDSGAVGPTGLQEKHVALSIAREVKAILDRVPGYVVKLTRDDDVFIPLRKRTEFAREADADLFVSIHADAFHDHRAHGSSVYVLSNRGASSEYGRLLAQRENAADLVGGIEYRDRDDAVAAVLLDISMNAAIEASGDIASRVLSGMGQLGSLHKSSVQRAGFVVLKSPDVPSILVETAFISNPREERNLGSLTHRRKIASALSTGIQNYFNEYRPSGVVQVARADGLTPREHRVRSGETLSGIAERYGIGLRELRATNDLRNDVIRIGQRLRIPVRTASR